MENRKNTRNIKQLKNSLKNIIVFNAFLISAVYSLIKSIEKGNMPIGPYIGIIFIVCLYIILFRAEEGKFIDFVFKKINKKDDYVGFWNIKIVYHLEDGNEVIRTGGCKIENSIIGLRIDGGKILDSNNNVEVDDWNSNNVEIIEMDDETKLIYTYLTYDSPTANTPSKIGMVILSRKRSVNEPFKGEFRDYHTVTGKKVRGGQVILFQS